MPGQTLRGSPSEQATVLHQPGSELGRVRARCGERGEQSEVMRGRPGLASWSLHSWSLDTWSLDGSGGQ